MAAAMSHTSVLGADWPGCRAIPASCAAVRSPLGSGGWIPGTVLDAMLAAAVVTTASSTLSSYSPGASTLVGTAPPRALGLTGKGVREQE